ncbi:MAG: hypothetical protein QM811_07485 [Pirellulales bacterium]
MTHVWRDASGRLTIDVEGIASLEYPSVCRRIAEAFALSPAGEPLVGPDELFWTFRRGDLAIDLDWDVWNEFMIVARRAEAESLVTEIANWVRASGGGR